MAGDFFNGVGTPWGGTKYDAPGRPKLNNDPWSVPGVDQSPLRAAMMQRLAKSTGRAQEGGQAMLSKAGLYDSSQQGALARDIGDQSTQNQAAMEAQLQQQDYQNRLGLMNTQNENALGEYAIDAGNYNNEQNNRNQFWGSLLGTGANLAGHYISSRK